MAKTEIYKLSLEGDQFVSMAQKMQTEIIRLNKEQKDMKGTTAESSEAFIRNSVSLKENKSQYSQLQKQISNNNQTQKDFNDVSEETNDELKREAVTINELRSQNKKLLDIKNNLILTNEDELKLSKEIDKKLNDNNDTIKENSDALSQQKINIGNYGSALGGVGGQLGAFITQGQALVAGLKAQRVALSGTSKGLKAFRIALIATGIGAIVVALGALVGMFLKTQSGVDSLTRVFTPLKIIFESFIGVMQTVGETIFKAFNDPKQTIIDLGNLIKTNITNRIDGLVEVFKILSSGSLDGLGEALSKTATGVENLGSKMKDFANDSVDFINEAVERGNKIADLGIEAEKAEIELVRLQTKNLAIIKEAELISKDKAKTDEERQMALNNAIKASKELEKTEQNILDLKIEKLTLEQISNDTNREDQLELANLEKERADATIAQQATEMKFLGVKNQLENESAKQAEKIAKERIASTIENLNLDLELFKENNRQKLESDGELNSALVKTKIETLRFINTKELEELQFHFDNKLIKQKEFDLAKLQLENEFQAQKTELLQTLASEEEAKRIASVEAEREQKQIEFEIELEENSIKRQTEFERKLEDEAIQFEMDQEFLNQQLTDKQLTQDQFDRLSEVAQKKHNDNLNKLNKAKADVDKRINEELRKSELVALGATLGIVSDLLGQNSKEGKAFAVAEALINTYLGISAGVSLGYPAAIPAVAAAAVAGFGAVKNIVSTKPKAEAGMLIGPSHSSGGIHIEAEGGEAVINKKSMQNPMLRSLASQINVAGGGRSFFAEGGLVGSSINSSINSALGVSLDQIDVLIDGKISNIQVQNVATETLDVGSDVLAVENFANL